MTWLKLVPTWCWVAVGALLVIGGQQLRIGGLQTDLARAESRYDKHIAEDAAATAAATEAARVEEQRRQAVIEGIENETMQKVADAKADSDKSGDALERLQQRYAQLLATSRACGNSITASLGQTANNAARVQADLFGRVGQTAKQYADIADQRGIAGSGCERSYDAINPR